MKDKPTKWGIKAFVLADARNGYLKSLRRNVENRSDVGLCTNCVGFVSRFSTFRTACILVQICNCSL